MKQIFMRGLLSAAMVLGVSHQAQAHVFNTTIGLATGDSYSAGDFFSDYGWYQGTIQHGTPGSYSIAQKGPLATTDETNWYKFTLDKTSLVSLTISSSGIASTPLSSVGFSLYSGQVVDGSFDVTPATPSAIAALTGSNLASYKTNDPNGYALTTQTGDRGLVNTLGSFALTTDRGAWQSNIRTLNFLTDATDSGHTGTASLVNYLLGPGTYTVVAGGANQWTASNDLLANFSANVSYSSIVAPAAVPVPSAIWLMGSVLAGFKLFGQRKSRLALAA